MELIKKSMFVGLILLLNSFFFQIYNISDQLMLGFYSMEIELGKYATAYQITAVLTLFFTIVISAINPQIIKNLSDKIRFLAFVTRIRKILFITVTAISLIAMFLSGYIYQLLFPIEFSGANVAFNILLASLIFNIFNIFTGNMLQNMSHEKFCLWAVAFGGMLNILLNFYFIQFGAIGVALTTFFTNIIVFILLSFFFHYAQKDYWKTHQ